MFARRLRLVNRSLLLRCSNHSDEFLHANRARGEEAPGSASDFSREKESAKGSHAVPRIKG